MEIRKAAQPVLAKEALDEHIEKNCEKLKKIDLAYAAGYMTEAERGRSLRTEIWEACLRYLEANGLECLPHIPKNRNRFLEDYAAYKTGKEPQSEIEAPWLRCRNNSSRETVYEANSADKTSFFKMMEAFRIPAEFFMP